MSVSSCAHEVPPWSRCRQQDHRRHVAMSDRQRWIKVQNDFVRGKVPTCRRFAQQCCERFEAGYARCCVGKGVVQRCNQHQLHNWAFTDAALASCLCIRKNILLGHGEDPGCAKSISHTPRRRFTQHDFCIPHSSTYLVSFVLVRLTARIHAEEARSFDWASDGVRRAAWWEPYVFYVKKSRP